MTIVKSLVTQGDGKGKFLWRVSTSIPSLSIHKTALLPKEQFTQGEAEEVQALLATQAKVLGAIDDTLNQKPLNDYKS